MTERFIEDELDRKLLLRFIEGHKLPFSVSIVRGRKRTVDQNRLQRLWLKEIAEQLPDQSAEEWRGYCKLHFGVPIMRNASEEYCEKYDRLIKPLSYVEKLELMRVPMDFPVTSAMNTKQKTDYLDAVYKHFTEQGLKLTIPPDPLLKTVRSKSAPAEHEAAA